MTTPEQMDIPDLRKDHDRLKKKVAFYESRELAHQLEAIGLEPDRGLGKAIATGFRGDLEDGAVATYAKEEYDYSYTPPAEGAAPDQVEPESDPTADTRTRELAGAQAPIDQTMAASASAMPTSIADRIRNFDQKAGEGTASAADARAAIENKLTAFEVSQ